MERLIWLLICFTIAASACKKSNVIVPVDSDVIARFAYKPGTYWVYKDAVTGEIDSFIVTQDGYSRSSNGSNFVFNDISMAISHYGINDSGKSQITLLADEINFDWVMGSYDPITVYPFKIGSFSAIHNAGGNLLYGYSSDIAAISNMFYTYSLNLQQFDTVAEITHTSEPGNTTSIINDTIYMNAKAGIIKMIFHHPNSIEYDKYKVWELQRYNIVK